MRKNPSKSLEQIMRAVEVEMIIGVTGVEVVVLCKISMLIMAESKKQHNIFFAHFQI